MPDRRYNENEMAAIFRTAAEGPQLPSGREVPRDEGMTLAELQSIGQEVGIAPEAVAQAALALDVQREARPSTLLGLPIGVSRTVQLHRRLSDEEWERFVVQLREVFHARGVMRSEGSLRHWSNGNLQVLLEPTESGHRLRFRTINGQAVASMRVGIVALVAAGVTALVTSLNGNLASAAGGIGILVAAGVAFLANGVLRLPRWARTRERQMEDLATRVAAGKEGIKGD
jgi:hypothetical protein